MRIEERWFRTIGFISYRGAGGKESNIQNFWYIEGEEKKEHVKKVWGDTPEEIRANIEKVKKAHNIK